MARGPKGSSSKRMREQKGATAEDSREEATMGADAASQKSLYDMLSVDKKATSSEIKKAYHRLALACHPDKHPDEPEAKERFQQLQRVKEVLMNEEKRKVYDETGVIMGEDGLGDLQGKSFEKLYQYYRAMHQQASQMCSPRRMPMFMEVTEDELKMWELKYPGSEDEKEDLIKYYKLRQGSMSLVTESIPFCEREDLYRVKQVVDQLIADGLLERTAKYDRFKPKKLTDPQIKAMKANRQPEEGWEEATDELQGKKKCKGGDDLFALIRARQSEKESAFDGMMTALEAKYGGKEAKGKRGKGRK